MKPKEYTVSKSESQSPLDVKARHGSVIIKQSVGVGVDLGSSDAFYNTRTI